MIREDPIFQSLGQVFAGHQLHRKETDAVRFVESVNGGDVGMVERCQYLGLALEAGEALGIARELRGEDLDRDVTGER